MKTGLAATSLDSGFFYFGHGAARAGAAGSCGCGGGRLRRCHVRRAVSAVSVRRTGCLFRVQRELEDLAGLEREDAALADLDRIPGLGIPPWPLALVPKDEVAEAAD